MGEMLTATVSPALDHIIERPRLIARIVEGDARVTVFAAPAGYGKTTLARQWGERQTGPVVWYRTTRASGDVAALAVGMDEVLASIAPPDLPRDPGRVARIASVNPSPRPLGRALVRTYEPLTRDVLLIVDEWEAAGTDEAEQLLSTLVDELDIRFLITSRTRPEWFTPRLEVYGQGLEIGVDELTMTEEEATQVLASSTAAIGRARLLRAAAGWPAVVGLAAMSREVDVTPERLMSRTLYDYLAQELLASVTEETQRALMLLAAASISDRARARILLAAEAKDATNEAVSRGLLATDGHHTISLHPLLRELLTDRFRRATGEFRRELITRCRTLVSQRLWDEALLVAETLPDKEFVTEAISAALPELLAAGRTSSLLRWVDAARLAGAQSPIVDFAESEVLFRRGAFDRALVLARRASTNLDGDIGARAHLTAARAAHLGNWPSKRDAHLEAAEQCVDESSSALADALWLKFAYATAEERPGTLELLKRYEAVGDGTYDRDLRIAEAHIHLGLAEGRLDERMGLAELNMSVFDSATDPYAKSSLLNIYANALSTQGRYAEALKAADREFALGAEYGLEFVYLYGLNNKARSLTGLRRFADAKRLLAEVERRLRTAPDQYVEGQHTTYLAALYLSTGHPERAVDVLARGFEARADSSLQAEFRAMNALALAATGNFGEADAQAHQARELSRVVEVRALLAAAQALRAAADHDSPKLLASCDTILELGARDALVLAWRVSHEVARQLLAVPKHREPVIRLLIASHDHAVARRAGFRIPRDAQPAGILSPREREVHDLVAQGLTNEEIARLLYISLSTTKVHVKHILEKLGVRSRVEAARAWYAEQESSAPRSGDPPQDRRDAPTSQ
jgi:ATP/maltotriose-dependent transcriptional regulator MalT